MKKSVTKVDRFNHHFEYRYDSEQCKMEISVDNIIARTYYGERAKQIYESVTE